MSKLIYNFYLFYKSSLLETIEMQINNKLILIDNNFVNNKKEAIQVAKLITKNYKYLIFV